MARRQASSSEESSMLKLMRRIRSKTGLKSSVQHKGFPKVSMQMINLIKITPYGEKQAYKQHIPDESPKWVGV
jgi:hypothetical protein